MEKETETMNKTTLKLLLGLSIATAATAIIAIGVIRELKSMKSLTIDTDELPEDFVCPVCYHGAEDFEPLNN